MRLRTTLAAVQAAALLALVTCAEPPAPTAADPIGLGAGTPPGAAAPLAQAYVEGWPNCKIMTNEGWGPGTLTGRRGKALGPPPRPVPYYGTVNVLEGSDMVADPPQMLFYPVQGCPTRDLHGVDLSIRLDSIWLSPRNWNWGSGGPDGPGVPAPLYPPICCGLLRNLRSGS